MAHQAGTYILVCWELYFLPEYHGATSNLLASVATNEIVCVTQEITLQEHDNEHQEYFEYVRQGLSNILKIFLKVWVWHYLQPGRKLFHSMKD